MFLQNKLHKRNYIIIHIHGNFTFLVTIAGIMCNRVHGNTIVVRTKNRYSEKLSCELQKKKKCFFS